ncbi:MAG: porin family protein [Methylococcales bacterium]|nr:porin family protein [Methylococcales bacterium]
MNLSNAKPNFLLITLLSCTATALVSTAQANETPKKYKHVKSVVTSTAPYSLERINEKVNALESQLQAVQAENRNLRAVVNRPHVDQDTAKVQELEAWANSVKAEGTTKGSKDNLVFFRGGYNHANNGRGGITGANAGGGLLGSKDLGVSGDPLAGANPVPQDAWYFGAGFDWSLNDGLFGLAPKGTELFAELMFDYKEFQDRIPIPLTSQGVTVSQFTLAASPKVKLFKGSDFRPWLIPAGLEINVISPPSSGVTYINPGIQFGAGADYKVWKDLYAGVDARYHLSLDANDGVRTDGVSAGGYLGFGF